MKTFKTTAERRATIKPAIDLLMSQNLRVTASFIDDVYILGCYSDSKVYTKRAKKEITAIENRILLLARESAMFKRDEGRAIAGLANVMMDVEGHKYRADRILEDRGI